MGHCPAIPERLELGRPTGLNSEDVLTDENCR
jgi:hypothetical protein